MGMWRSLLGIEPPRVAVPQGVRNPKAATLNVSYVSPGAPMLMEWSAEDAMRWGYLANVVVYRCVQLIAETIAALPFRAGPSLSHPDNFNEGAPLARLLGPPPYGPNPEMAANELIANAVSQFLVSGRFGWELELNPSKTPVALWPLAAQRLKAIPTTGRRSNQYFEGFMYGPPGDETRLSVDEVFYCWRPALHDIRQPESALQAARLDISVAVMQDRYDHAFLKNDARPATIMTVQRFEEDDEFKAFKDQVNSDYGGPDNAGKMMIHEVDGDENGNVNNSLLVQTLGISQKDAEFIKRHEEKFRNIALALGVPWSKLDASGRTYDNADAEDATWEESCIIPIARRIQNRINMKLAPRLGNEVGWFEILTLKTAQPKKRFISVPLTDAVGTLCSTNEAREDAGLPPVEGGDDFDPAAKPEPPVMPQVAPSPMPAELPPAQDMSKTMSGDMPKAMPRAHRVEPIDHSVRRRKVWTRVDAQAKLQEARMKAKFQRLFDAQSQAVIDRIEGRRGRQALKRDINEPVDAVFDKEFWRTKTKDMTDEVYQDLFTLGAARITEAFGMSFDLEAEYAQEFVLTRSSRLADSVTATTHDAIRNTLSEGIAEGEGIPELADRIKALGAFEPYRAEMIARTEVLGSYNEAANTAARQLPSDVVGGKEWITSGAIDECTDYEDAGPIPIGDNWDGADTPPLHPNCRCTIAFLTPDEMAEFDIPRAHRRISVVTAWRIIERLAA